LIALDTALFYLPTAHTFPPLIEFFKSLLMTLPFGPLWEELAWRGLVLRRLETRYSLLVSALILGVYWAVWHTPLWLVTVNLNRDDTVPILLLSFISVVALSIIFAFFYDRSLHSLSVVILLHATYVAASSQAFAVSPQLNAYQIFISTILFVGLGATLGQRMVRDATKEAHSETVKS
jgi:membrane protease YdiL (CAAX protease family)